MLCVARVTCLSIVGLIVPDTFNHNCDFMSINVHIFTMLLHLVAFRRFTPCNAVPVYLVPSGCSRPLMTSMT